MCTAEAAAGVMTGLEQADRILFAQVRGCVRDPHPEVGTVVTVSGKLTSGSRERIRR